MRRTARTVTFVVAVAAASILTACAAAEKPPVALPSASATAGRNPQTSQPPDPSSSGDPHTNVQRQAIDAYLGAQRAYLKAAEAGDPDHPDLATYVAGRALAQLRAGLRSLRDKGLLSRGETKFNPVVASLEPPRTPSKVRVRDCMDTRGSQAYKASGEPYNDTPGGWRLVIADLEIIDNTWKVTGIGIHGVGSCAG